MDRVELGLFVSRLQAVCEEMGATLRRTAFSPNIKDRLDYSCAVFSADGALCAQAAHIPVHLGSMAYAMGDVVDRIEWSPNDMVVLNDPFLGGTHLPDVTLIAPLFVEGELTAFCANRAHHADIGADTPGSMPLSRQLEDEGLVLSPQHYLRRGQVVPEVQARLEQGLRNPDATLGDFAAQLSANRTGLQRLVELVEGGGRAAFENALDDLNDYAEALASSAIESLPDGIYCSRALLDDDGAGTRPVALELSLHIDGSRARLDFTGSSPQVSGNVNCPLAVTAAAAYYAFYALMPSDTPACAGSLRVLDFEVPRGSVLNASNGAAVAAGNVETSQRVVDLVLAALAEAVPDRIPAASQGTMNNVAMGASDWDYYETIGGGTGGHADGPGLNGVHSHMTNTLNTPAEVLEMNYPLRVTRYALRRGSGGRGRHDGGNGLVREYEFLAPAEITLLSERRLHAPPGAAGGSDGMPGRNRLNGEACPPKCHLEVSPGDRLSIETPGGGGWGKPAPN